MHTWECPKEGRDSKTWRGHAEMGNETRVTEVKKWKLMRQEELQGRLLLC